MVSPSAQQSLAADGAIASFSNNLSSLSLNAGRAPQLKAIVRLPSRHEMLVVHWAKHNQTGSILANGIRPTYRRRDGERRNCKGVYVYPFSRNKTLNSNWRRNLKTWDTQLGNYNGFIFRLVQDDFPLIAGYWFFNRSVPRECIVPSLEVLAEKYGDIFSGKVLNPSPEGLSYNWRDFEIIVPRHVRAQRIEKVLRDREPNLTRRAAI